jgi:hypothetical protein
MWDVRSGMGDKAGNRSQPPGDRNKPVGANLAAKYIGEIRRQEVGGRDTGDMETVSRTPVLRYSSIQ